MGNRKIEREEAIEEMTIILHECTKELAGKEDKDLATYEQIRKNCETVVALRNALWI